MAKDSLVSRNRRLVGISGSLDPKCVAPRVFLHRMKHEVNDLTCNCSTFGSCLLVKGIDARICRDMVVCHRSCGSFASMDDLIIVDRGTDSSSAVDLFGHGDIRSGSVAAFDVSSDSSNSLGDFQRIRGNPSTKQRMSELPETLCLDIYIYINFGEK